MNIETALHRLVAYYEELTPAHLSQLSSYYHAQAYFKDPFHEVVGIAAIAHIFQHMFQLDPDAKFTFSHCFVAPDKPLHAMLIWQMSITMAGRHLSIAGSSHLVFDNEGMVISHRDYWDTGEELYAKLPWIGGLMRALLRKGSAFR